MKIKQQQYQELLSRDQLNMERADGKVFLFYGESQAISFFSKNHSSPYKKKKNKSGPNLLKTLQLEQFLFWPKLPLSRPHMKSSYVPNLLINTQHTNTLYTIKL